jgi:hypothetical protein
MYAFMAWTGRSLRLQDYNAKDVFKGKKKMVVPACTTPVTTDESEGGFPH